MLKIKVSTKESSEIIQISHFRESDLLNIIQGDDYTIVLLKDTQYGSNNAVSILTREPIELSEYSSLIEVKENTIVEHRSGRFHKFPMPMINPLDDIAKKEGGESVINKESNGLPYPNLVTELLRRKVEILEKENKELRFRLTDVIDELKQRLDKLENK